MYGTLITIGIIIAIFYTERSAKLKGYDLEVYWRALFFLILSVLLGSRGYYVIENWHIFGLTPIMIPMIWGGGMVIIGGILLGIPTLIVVFKKLNQPVAKWLDLFALPIPLAQAIGRWGNFFNNEHMPFAIYESALDLILFLVLFLLEKRRSKDGTIFWVYIIGYILIRLVLRPLR